MGPGTPDEEDGRGQSGPTLSSPSDHLRESPRKASISRGRWAAFRRTRRQDRLDRGRRDSSASCTARVISSPISCSSRASRPSSHHPACSRGTCGNAGAGRGPATWRLLPHRGSGRDRRSRSRTDAVGEPPRSGGASPSRAFRVHPAWPDRPRGVLPCHADPVESYAFDFSARSRRRLLRHRNRGSPLIVVQRKTVGVLNTPAKFIARMKSPVLVCAVPEEDEDCFLFAAELHGPSDPDRMRQLRADRGRDREIVSLARRSGKASDALSRDLRRSPSAGRAILSAACRGGVPRRVRGTAGQSNPRGPSSDRRAVRSRPSGQVRTIEADSTCRCRASMRCRGSVEAHPAVHRDRLVLRELRVETGVVRAVVPNHASASTTCTSHPLRPGEQNARCGLKPSDLRNL